MSGFSKQDYELINLGVCIKQQAERLGIEHEGVPLEGVVVRIAERAGAVVAEEPEWEYGIKCPPMDVAWLGTRESVEATLARWADAGAPLSEGQGVFRRIKQGPWVPVKQEGTD